jgi:hypothetical protein
MKTTTKQVQKIKTSKRINQSAREVSQEKNEDFPKETRDLADRLNKLDDFIAGLIEESKGTLQPQAIIEMLIIKARHAAFVFSADAGPEPVLGWMTGMLYFNARSVFTFTKAHSSTGKENKKR